MKNKKSLKFTHTTWFKLMNTKNKYDLNSLEEVIICYQKLMTEYKLHNEFEKIIKKLQDKKNK